MEVLDNWWHCGGEGTDQCGEWGCGEVEEEGGQDSCLAELCWLVRRGDAGS